MKPKIINRYNAKPDQGLEQEDKVSITAPNEAETVAQLLQRHINGMPLSARPGEYYDPEEEELETSEDIEKIKGLDLYDQEQYKNALREKIEKGQNSLRDLKSQHEAAKKAEKEAKTE